MDDLNVWSVIQLVSRVDDEQEKYICKYHGTSMCQYIKDPAKGCMSCPIMQGILSKAADMEMIQNEVLGEKIKEVQNV